MYLHVTAVSVAALVARSDREVARDGERRMGEDHPEKSGTKASPSSSSFFQQILAKAREYIVTLVVTAIVAGIAAAWYKSEGALTTYLSGYVLSAVIEDLNKAEKSTLAKPITAVLARERAFEVGELNSGHFVLNPTNQAYSLVMYFPPESDGTLGVRLIGNVSSPNQVVLGFPEGGTKNIGTNGEQLINLTKFFSLPAPEGTLLSLDDGVFVRPKQFKDLRVITFQFLGPDVDKPPPNGPAPTIDVTYVALISPPIKLEQRQGQH